MIKWYSSKDLKIYFDKKPDPDIRFVEPGMTDKEIKDISEKPFILKNTVFCQVDYKKCIHDFKIEVGFTWDGATIPRFAWPIIGSKTDNRFLIASMVHDTLCKHHEYVKNNRYLSTKIFVALLEVAKVNKIKQFLMFHTVDNYQKLCWEEKN